MITLDIETLPTENPEIIAEIEASIKPPAQYKKPESIAQWMAENKEAEIKELVSETALDAAYGKIACIAWKYDDWPCQSTNADQTEDEAISTFYEGFATIWKTESSLLICGHFVKTFDLQFLKQRSIILGIRPPKALLEVMNCSLYDDRIADTNLMWTGDRNKRIKLDTLCKILGIEGKNGFDGSMVAETWKTDKQKVIDYCKQDVELAYKVYNKLTFNYSVF